MSTGYSFRAYPNNSVARVLARWSGCQCFIKNAKVREGRYYRTFQRHFAAFAGQHAPMDQAQSHLIGDGSGCEDANAAWLREVPSHVLRNSAVRFYQAYQRFFKGLARQPTMRGPHGEQSVRLTSELSEFVPSAHGADGLHRTGSRADAGAEGTFGQEGAAAQALAAPRRAPGQKLEEPALDASACAAVSMP